MEHYDFAQKFRAAYDKAVRLYGQGMRDPEALFSPSERAWLAGNGLSSQNFFDYAEDQHNGGEPGLENAIAIESVRRDYFLNVQRGRPSTVVLAEESLPAKTDAVQGIEWLPRIIPKARAKLRGELPRSLMYCCGGDRRFFKARDIMPAEFLSLVWRHEKDDAAVVAWVVSRGAAK